MLVKCYDHPELREWYATNSTNEVQIGVVLRWQPDAGLALMKHKTLAERRYDVAGTVLRVAAVRVCIMYRRMMYYNNRFIGTN